MKRRVASPQQDRSRKTLERILDTAGRMLEDGSFEEATVQQIVESARSSIGSFYARFRDKRALLDHLIARVHDAMLAEAVRLRQDPRWRQAPLEQRLAAYVTVAAGWTQAHRGILRARLLHHLALGEAVPRDQVEKSRRLLTEARAFIGGGRRPRGVDDALQLIDAMIGARYLLSGPGLWTFPESSEATFRRNVVRAALSLLDGG